MFIVTSICDWKCCRDGNFDKSICQNNFLSKHSTIDIPNKKIIELYINNHITKSIVFGGLEPMLQFQELISFIDEFRKVSEDDIVIYTGYYKEEIEKEIEILKKYKNIIIKFGRYIPNRKSRYDEVLGVTFISDNQYAEKIS